MMRALPLHLPVSLAAAGVLLLIPTLTYSQESEPLSVPQLLRNLESDDAHIAASAARSLGVVFAPGGLAGEDRDKVIAALITHLDSTKGPDVRRQCATALGQIRATEAAEPMKKALLDTDIEVVLAAGTAVAEILPADDARAYLTEVGGGEETLAKVGAYHGLASIAKPQDAQFLLGGLALDNWRAQQAAVRGLHRAVGAGAELEIDEYKSIAAILGADTNNAADAAVHFFSHTHTPHSLAALRDAADPEIHPENWRQRSKALRAIRHRNWPRNREELPLVVRNLGDKTANVNNEVFAIIKHLRDERFIDDRTLMPILVAELERAGPLDRRGAIMKLMPHDIEQVYASRAAVVAAKTLTESAEIEDAWSTRAQALRIIGVTGYSGVMEDVAKAVDSNVANVRSAAGNALERLGPVCPAEEAVKVAPILLPHLSEAIDWRKTSVAAGAIGAYADESTLDPLVDLLGHAVLNVRRSTSRSLVLIAKGKDAALRSKLDSLLHAKMEENAATWEYGAPVLAALDDTKAVPLLTRMLASEDWLTVQASARAVEALARDHDLRAEESLTKALIAASQSRVTQVQQACDLALRHLTKSDE